MTNFQIQFEELKNLDLPPNQFLVVGSGPMSIREIRDSEDIDVIVTLDLWNELIRTYSVEPNSWGVERISIGDNIEILNPDQSIFSNSSIIPVDDVHSQADTFDGIKFLHLEHLKVFKKKLGREKDLRDIELIDRYIHEQL